MALVELSRRERRIMHQLLAQATAATTLRRAQALAWLDRGESVQEIAARLQVSRQVIYQWVALFQQRAAADLPTRLAAGARSGRPRTLHGLVDPLLDAVVDNDPRDFGYHSTIWTAPLLVEYLAETHDLCASVQSVRLALTRLGISWKRPRHQLALRSATWRQAKGGLKRGWRRASAPSSCCLTRFIVCETPPLYSCYGRRGAQVCVPITGARSKRILHGALNVSTGSVLLLITAVWTEQTHQYFLQMIRAYWRGWHVVLFEDRGTPHTAEDSLEFAADCGIEVRLLPRATPELNAMAHLWRFVKGRGLADRQTRTIADSADQACRYVLDMSRQERLRKAGVLSGHFWLTTC